MIHPNVFFLILLICCWVVAESLMAEKTNVGVAVFLQVTHTYVCGFGSDGAAALLLLARLSAAAVISFSSSVRRTTVMQFKRHSQSLHYTVLHAEMN